VGGGPQGGSGPSFLSRPDAESGMLEDS